MKVNELKFDGVVKGDEIEGVDEGQTVACPPAARGERGGHGRRSAVMVCMHFRSGGKPEHNRWGGIPYVPNDCKLLRSWQQTILGGRRGFRPSPFRINLKIPTHVMAAATLAVSYLGVLCDVDHELFQQRSPPPLSFCILQNIYTLYSPLLPAARIDIRFCGRFQDRLYLAASLLWLFQSGFLQYLVIHSPNS